MAIRTPEPRIPLEPEEYPLYKPPRRFGCSGLTVVTLLTLAVFGFLAWKVTPPLARAITDFPKSLPIIGSVLQSGSPTPIGPGADTTPVAGGATNFATETVVAAQPTVAPAPTAVAPPTAAPTNTAVIEYVKVANTAGQGVRLRKQPTSNASYDTAVNEGEVLKIIGPDTPDTRDSKLIWRHIARISKADEGYILSKFLISSPPPAP